MAEVRPCKTTEISFRNHRRTLRKIVLYEDWISVAKEPDHRSLFMAGKGGGDQLKSKKNFTQPQISIKK
jgi:hypothetical protein